MKRRSGCPRVLLGLAIAGSAAAVPKSVNRIAAIVNEEMILMSEVEVQAASDLTRSQRTLLDLPAKERTRVLRETLDALIGERLMDAEIKAANIEVTDREIEDAMNDTRKQYKLDEEQFARELERGGFTQASYREMVKQQIARQYLLRFKVLSKVRVSDEDVKAEYAKRASAESGEDEVRVRQILLKLPKDAKPAQEAEVKARSDRIVQRARAKEDFVELVKKYSEGPSREDGGDVGYFRKGLMTADFEKASFGLKVGEVSDPVKTQYGYHILQLVDRRRIPPPPFETIRQELREKLLREQQAQYIKSYVDELKRAAQIEIKVPELRADGNAPATP